MVKLVLNHVNTVIVGSFYPDYQVNQGVHDAIRKELSYLVPDSDYSALFKAQKWDGRISLYSKRNQSFPTGCVTRLARLLNDLDIEYEVEDIRVRPRRTLDLTVDMGDREARFYQIEAVKRAYKNSRGILAVGTGGGKTIMSCLLLAKMGVGPVIFVVPSKSLLYQTADEFEKYLRLNGETVQVGRIGDGLFEPQLDGINVCTYQTLLLAYDEIYKEKKGTDKSGNSYGPNVIIVEPMAGETVKKTTVQLLKDFEVAEAAHLEARARAKSIANESKPAYVELNQELQLLLDIASPSKSEIRRIGAVEKKLDKLKRSVQHKMKLATTKDRQAEEAARVAYNTRIHNEERKVVIKDLFERAQGFIVDEAHVAAVVIEKLGEHARNAFYRFGITATPYREDNQQIRIEGTFGRILINVSVSDLIKLGYLVKPFIRCIPIEHTEFSKDYDDAYDKHIIRDWERNYRIKQFAEEFFERGIPTIILVDRLEHGQILEAMIRNSVFVAGGDTGEDDPTEAERQFRKQILAKTQRNEQILIATKWANVGIDAPLLQGLILGGSESSMTTIMQQIGRVLRSAVGKVNAYVITFMSSQKHLHDHAVTREKIFRSEDEFDYKRVRS